MAAWTEITTLEEWQALLDESDQQPILLLKHSTTCPVSANALKEFEDYIAKGTDSAKYALVKVIESRPVSNQIAEDLQVKHESPQIIWFKNKKQQWNTSHWAVTVEHISAVLD